MTEDNLELIERGPIFWIFRDRQNPNYLIKAYLDDFLQSAEQEWNTLEYMREKWGKLLLEKNERLKSPDHDRSNALDNPDTEFETRVRDSKAQTRLLSKKSLLFFLILTWGAERNVILFLVA